MFVLGSFWFVIIFIQLMANCFEISHQQLSAINITEEKYNKNISDDLDYLAIRHEPQINKSRVIEDSRTTTAITLEPATNITEISKIESLELYMNDTTEPLLEETLHVSMQLTPILMTAGSFEHVNYGLEDTKKKEMDLNRKSYEKSPFNTTIKLCSRTYE